MKNILRFILISAFLGVFLSGCSNGNNEILTDETTLTTVRESRQIDLENPEREVYENGFEFVYDEWTLSPILQLDSEEWYAANNSINDAWRVSLENGIVMINESKYFDAFRFDLSDGYFIGENHGEWGGTLTYNPLNGDSYSIENCNAVGMFSVENDFYLLEGISHLVLSDGYIFNVKMNNGKWELGDNIKLKGSPMAFTSKGDILYVVTDVAIIEVKKEANTSAVLKASVLANHEFMSGLYPDSIVQVNDTLYIGMRGGILIFNLNNEESSWYTKK